MRTILTLIVLLSIAVLARADPPGSLREEFLSRGAAVALAACNLPKRTCDGKSLSVQSIELGESNDEKRSVEMLAKPGLQVMVAFALPNRQSYYLGVVDIKSGRRRTVGGIRIGSSRTSVLHALGEPDYWASSSCGRFVEVGTREAVVCFKSGRVSSLHWSTSSIDGAGA